MAGAYWIRLHLAEFDDPRWLIIESFPEVADTVQIIYMKLLCLAGKCNTGGMLVLPGGKPYGEEELAAVLRRQPTTVRAALQMLEGYGFVERVGDPPTLALPAWHDQDVDALALLANRRQRDADRKREKRQENKQLGTSSDVSADVPRNVRTQSRTKAKKNKKQQQQTPAAASTAAPATTTLDTLTPEILSAIHSLPPLHQGDALQVCQDELGGPSIKLAALHLFKARLADGKADSAAYLRTAIRKHWSLREGLESGGEEEAEAASWWGGLTGAEQKEIESLFGERQEARKARPARRTVYFRRWWRDYLAYVPSEAA